MAAKTKASATSVKSAKPAPTEVPVATEVPTATEVPADMPQTIGGNYNRGVVRASSLPKYLTSHDVYNWFAQFGKVTRTHVWKDSKTGLSKCYAFIEYQDRDVATYVAREMNGTIMMGKALKLEYMENMTSKRAGKLFEFARKPLIPKGYADAFERMWTMKVKAGEPAPAEDDRVRPCGGRKFLEAAGITCGWAKPFRSLKAALEKVNKAEKSKAKAEKPKTKEEASVTKVKKVSKTKSSDAPKSPVSVKKTTKKKAKQR